MPGSAFDRRELPMLDIELLIALIQLTTAVLALSTEAMRRRRDKGHPEARDSNTHEDK